MRLRFLCILFGMVFQASFVQLHCANQKVIEKGLNPKPYELPGRSPLRKTLNAIFNDPNCMKNENAFKKAGFKTLFFRKKGSLRVASHPDLKGYLFKLYLEDEVGSWMPERQNRLTQRCVSAAQIRKRIKKEKMKFFTVPDKWLYKVPKRNYYVLVVQDMKLTSRKKSEKAWKKKITVEHLHELYHILNDGYASLAITQNIAYTKKGTFACIDTEFGKRKFDMSRIMNKLSPSIRWTWDSILMEHDKLR